MATYSAVPSDIQDVESGISKRPVSEEWEITVRLGFIRKVYGILSAQLLLTVGIASLIMFVPAVHMVATSSPGMFYAALFLPLILLLVLMCVRESYPTNFIVLFLFTCCQGYTVGVVCTSFDTITVLEAVGLTAAIVVGLTIYTFQSKRDFSFLGAGLFAALVILIIASVIQMFVRAPWLDFAISVGGACIFSLYIVFDTSMLMERHSVDEYILAAINLYLDIINLFMYILRILAELKGNQ
mmetsp:Transcript_1658/g.3173  ORF Transcript_1658/g.3173 Transcript_1658/m.3173 type:complete len:241 (-) Transcript_1658:511-1233(-)|eukprot:CAMPEP_0196651948 /NCGR_PEP_ID=MMETSP1086-20130531/1142_1 /TAXON_ID=77921 /ORGANISM="Cyanoptyche  gloeocystis , Strain SAG4.97" /LENGTH=240 /DNA_ID=CAMNT_0041982253 /DNA_START=82 /DNA_END=804 /DNA_ORIENTATION=-